MIGSIKSKIFIAVVLFLIAFCTTLIIMNIVQNAKLEKARNDLHDSQISNSVAIKDIAFESEKKDIVSNFVDVKKRIENIEDEELSYEVKTILFDVRRIYYSSFTN